MGDEVIEPSLTAAFNRIRHNHGVYISNRTIHSCKLGLHVRRFPTEWYSGGQIPEALLTLENENQREYAADDEYEEASDDDRETIPNEDLQEMEVDDELDDVARRERAVYEELVAQFQQNPEEPAEQLAAQANHQPGDVPPRASPVPEDEYVEELLQSDEEDDAARRLQNEIWNRALRDLEEGWIDWDNDFSDSTTTDSGLGESDPDQYRIRQLAPNMEPLIIRAPHPGQEALGRVLDDSTDEDI